MPEEAATDFSLPWCQNLFNDPTWRPIYTLSRVEFQTGTMNSLLAKTLWTDRAVRAVQSFEKVSANAHVEEVPEEVCMLYSLGDGLDGADGVCHGGVVGILLDEVLGLMVAVITGKYQSVTAELNVSFKQRLMTPQVVLCKARLDADREAQGRKFWVKGTVEDGAGGVFAEGRALFVMLKEKL